MYNIDFDYLNSIIFSSVDDILISRNTVNLSLSPPGRNLEED